MTVDDEIDFLDPLQRLDHLLEIVRGLADLDPRAGIVETDD